MYLELNQKKIKRHWKNVYLGNIEFGKCKFCSQNNCGIDVFCALVTFYFPHGYATTVGPLVKYRTDFCSQNQETLTKKQILLQESTYI